MCVIERERVLGRERERDKSPVSVELSMLGHDPVPLGLGVDNPKDPGLLLERVPSE